MKKESKRAAAFAILAAALYAVNIPLSKLLLDNIGSTMLAALLYLGAGLGLGALSLAERLRGRLSAEQRLTKKELPYTIGMILLDIAAPVLLMLGLRSSSSESVSLLGNFEIVATSIMAMLLFGEVVSKRLWTAIALITISSLVLSFEGVESFSFSTGSLLVLSACLCWGLENNCTRMLSSKSATEIVVLKGTFSGLGSLIIAFSLGQRLPALPYILAALALGFVAYGLSIYFYILAQRNLGAAKTSAYYAATPFLGVGFSFLIFREIPGVAFFAALAIMGLGAYLSVTDTIAMQHTHEHTHTHTHEHRHGDLVHTHQHTHEHCHNHVHGENGGEAHTHTYDPDTEREHIHL